MVIWIGDQRAGQKFVPNACHIRRSPIIDACSLVGKAR